MKDIKTESRILLAAEQIFIEQGYAAARMRDIAEQADVNLALINYYYKSKENLFTIVMKHKVEQLFGSILPCMNDEHTTLEYKTEMVCKILYEITCRDMNLPMFVFGELQKQGKEFSKIIPAKQVKNSVMIQQVKEQKPKIDPFHFVLNLLSMIFSPYIISPILEKTDLFKKKEIKIMLEERIKLIPMWMKQTLDL